MNDAGGDVGGVGEAARKLGGAGTGGDASEAYFVRLGADVFQPTELAVGPWNPEHLHGAPPTALMARSCAEALATAPDAGPGTFHLARLTVELLRPVPLRALAVRAVVGPGKATRRVQVTLVDREQGDKVVAEGVALGVRQVALTLPESAYGAAPSDAPPGPEVSTPHMLDVGPFAFGYGRSIELRLARGTVRATRVCMWMRPRVQLVAGEELTPLERVFACADSGSGVSQMLDPRATSFVNADLEVRLVREPRGAWICLDARTLVSAAGVGLTETRLWDAEGAFGSARQTLVLRAL